MNTSYLGRMRAVDRADLSVLYWETDLSAAALGERYMISPTKIHKHAGPAVLVGVSCRTCGGEIVESTRTAAANRIDELDRTHGWANAKHYASACEACATKERKEVDRAKYAKPDPTIDHVARHEDLRSMPYLDYLNTSEWKATRMGALHRAGFACQICYGHDDLHVHHRTYVNRGCELPADLTVLCRDCHELFHDRMKIAENRQASRPDLYDGMKEAAE